MENEVGRVLVVHGDGMSREGLRRRVEEAGHKTLEAADGPQALQVVMAEEPDLVIADASSSNVDVVHLVTTMQAESSAVGTIPVIVLAPQGATDVISQCMRAGASDFLFDPYSPTQLRTQMREYLAISARRRQDQRHFERETLLKIERDVQIGREIQAGFLPSDIPQPSGWDIKARLYPAREVAGDFYDVFTLTQGRRVGMVIADVCDKGVGAALFMALFRSLFRAYAQQPTSMHWTDILDERIQAGGSTRPRVAPQTGIIALRNAMDMTNDYIAKNHAEANMFATTFFAVLDPSSGILTYINGGHNPPFVLGADGVKMRLKPTGPAVGIFPGIEYKTGQVTLEPGDELFAFTDGVPDARNLKGESFTEPRLVQLLDRPALSAAAHIDRVDQAVHDHIGAAHQFDDITMLALRRTPPNDPPPEGGA